MNAPIRLHVFLARSGVASRRASEALILSGRVHVNGTIVHSLGTRVTPGTDRVSVDGKPLQFEKKVLFLFHKPRGVVTTLGDPHAKHTVADFLSHLHERVFPVGRLDADVSGLLLLTNDGEFAERLLHPRFQIERVYIAKVRGAAGKMLVERLKKGVRIDGGEKKSAVARIIRGTKPVLALLGPLGDRESYLEVRVREGAKHFVKKLLRDAGYPVVRLSRTGFGPYTLGSLGEGELRPARFSESAASS